MKAIAAVDENWGIGLKGKLLVSIPADSRNFREMTQGAIVVMGRKTLQSLPKGTPLEGRENLVLTTNPNFEKKNVLAVHSLKEALEKLEETSGKEIYVTGGESIFRQFLPYCDTAYITKIQKKFEADTFFPNLDEDKDWNLSEESEEQTYFDLEYYFLKYERVKG